MASAKQSYERIMEIADMSVADYRNDKVLGKNSKKKSDEEIQAVIDAAKQTRDANKDSALTWSSIMDEAQTAYTDLYKDSLSYLELTADVSEEDKMSVYQAAVSDNKADGTQLNDGVTLQNITVDAGDGTQVDWSETQTMKKTRLADGAFRNTDSSGKELDDFSGESVGATRNVAGGTITYLGVADYKFLETVDTSDKHWYDKFTSSYIPVTDDQKGSIVHYEGYLGSFDYNTRDFEIAYYETVEDGNKISVPVLHYIGDQNVGLIGPGSTSVKSGSLIDIPDGLAVGDYMFAGNSNIQSMPVLPDSIVSAHGMFMNCTGMTEACDDALDAEGYMKMPSKLKDISWMFLGCEHMTDSFGSLGEEMLDARYAFMGCKKLGYPDENGKDGEMDNTFKVPDMTHLRYSNEEYLNNMFDESNAAVATKISEYIAKGGKFTSSFTDENGAYNNAFNKIEDGSYDKDKEALIAEESERRKILKMIDPESNGMSGLQADTDGLMTTALQLTDTGTFADDSTWAKFLQDDFSGTYSGGNEFGNILNHAIPAVGTYAVSKSLLNKMTNGKHKALSTVGAVALAAVPQIVGYGDTLTPVLDWTANAVGKDTKVGTFLTSLSDKLQGNVNYSTKVEALDADKTFEKMQSSAVNYATKQLSGAFESVTPNADKDSVIGATVYKLTADMAANGKRIADDANLLFIACEPEENLKNTMSDSVMKVTIDTLDAKMKSELDLAGSDSEKIEEVRKKYSGYYQAMLYNLDAYDNAAVAELNNTYRDDSELRSQAMNGLEKVMRTTVKPLYDEMASLQTEWQEKYGTDFFSDKQLNDSSDYLSLRNFDITGLGKFADFDPNKDYSDQSDVYVEKLEVYQKALVEAVQNASSQEEIDAAYASYYETAYGWALDEAEAHGVVLDKRGAQTSAEKDSFAEYIAKAEAEQKENIELADNSNISTFVNTDAGETVDGDNTSDSAKTDAEAEAKKANERAAMVGISDADTEAAEKAAIAELNM